MHHTAPFKHEFIQPLLMLCVHTHTPHSKLNFVLNYHDSQHA